MRVQMVVVETVMTGLVDEFPMLGRNGITRIMTATVVAATFFCIGVPMVTQVVAHVSASVRLLPTPSS